MGCNRRIAWNVAGAVGLLIATGGASPAGAAADEPPQATVKRALEQVHEAMNGPDAAEAVARAVATWEPALRRLGDDPEAQEALLHLRVDLGRTYAEAGRDDDARTVFRSVADEAPDSPWAERAEGWLYELDHLKVGQPAPAFRAATVGGDSLSSEGLQGRVVVLSFWGTY